MSLDLSGEYIFSTDVLDVEQFMLLSPGPSVEDADDLSTCTDLLDTFLHDDNDLFDERDAFLSSSCDV